MVNPDFEPTEEENAVLEVLKAEERANPYLLREETGYDKGTVNTALTRLTSAGWVRKVTRGLYEYVDDPRDGQATDAESRRVRAPEEPPTDTPDDEQRDEEPAPVAEDTEPPEHRAELPAEIDDRVWSVVDKVTYSWDNDDRLDNRRLAAANVLQYAVSTGEPIGKSHEIVDAVRDGFPVEGQNRETYWRQNIREVLKEVGGYSRGKHAYTVEKSAEGVYDPTEEF